MRVIAVSTLKEFWERPQYRDAETPLKAWLEEVQSARWGSPADIKGNDYRLVVAVAYVYQAVYIKFVGTHEQYDAIDVMTVEQKQ